MIMVMAELILLTFIDTLVGHAIFLIYLMAVLDGRAVVRQLKKLPVLLLSPLTAACVNVLLRTAAPPAAKYIVSSLVIFTMCVLWTMWVWRLHFWQAFSAVCMSGIFQVATSALGQAMRLPGAYIAIFLPTLAVALLLKQLRFEASFRLLLEDGQNRHRIALLLWGMEFVMEHVMRMSWGVQQEYLLSYCISAVTLALLMAGLIVYLAQRLDTFQKMQVQQNIIAQQQLYERDLEKIRLEVRTFRHDYKNLLAGLSQQAEAGELAQLQAALAQLDAGFDRRLGEKILAASQIGNLQIPQVRSLLLSKLAAMEEKGVECRLEVLDPVADVGMDVWDFTRCLGILTDNAAEAALETDWPWVEVILLAQGGRVSLRVSNPWNGSEDPASFWNEGWSTKGAGRGLGLCSYQRILTVYPNASASASWKGGVFVQELIVEDRP